MNPRLFLHLYTVACMVDIYSRAAGQGSWEMLVKPLLMPLLMAWFFFSAPVRTALERWTLAALAFSWGGDVFLLFTDRSEAWFIAGLSSFLFGHLCYIQAFRQGPFLPAQTPFGGQAPERGLRPIAWAALPVLAFAGFLFWTIWPGLGEMALPVGIYSLVIASMAIAALNRYRKVSSTSFGMVLAGALIFVISDSTIAWNKFYQPFDAAGAVIMVTYLTAQLLIVAGVLAQRNRMDDEQLVGALTP